MKTFKEYIAEKKLTPAELDKREEIAAAIEKDQPNINMGKKMAIATAAAKRVAESVNVTNEGTKYSMISFKEYKQLYEETEAKIDDQINEAKRSLGIDENSPFDWKNTKSEINWDGKKKVEEPKEKKSVGRPSGQYGNYKIDKATRQSKEYKDALSAKVRAAKAEGFQIRDEFKKAMDDAIKKHQLKLAGIEQ